MSTIKRWIDNFRWWNARRRLLNAVPVEFSLTAGTAQVLQWSPIAKQRYSTAS